MEQGSWLPSVNISTLLTTIRLLMAEPNADDGLMPEIVSLHCLHCRRRTGKPLLPFHPSNSMASWIRGMVLQTDMFKHNRELFNRKATEMSVQHARSAEVKQSATRKAGVAAAAAASKTGQGEKAPPTAPAGKKQLRKDSAASDEDDDSFSDANSSSENDADGLSDFSDDASDAESSKVTKRRRKH